MNRPIRASMGVNSHDPDCDAIHSLLLVIFGISGDGTVHRAEGSAKRLVGVGL